jgi:F420-0:gamma-glutamyl ligase
MTRHIGTEAKGIRLPIVKQGDNLIETIIEALRVSQINLRNRDIIGVTEAIVAKSQGNYVDIAEITRDINEKFDGDTIGVVFPILSRNRFLNILRGIAATGKKIHLLLQCPNDEVGNPIMEFGADIESAKTYTHPFTGVNYYKLYSDVSPNIEIHLTTDPSDVLKYTNDILVAEIHNRFNTKRMLKPKARTIHTLCEVLGELTPFGVLGSNMVNDTTLKLFPRDCEKFVDELQKRVSEEFNVHAETLIYGDGAFKDPVCGIWELADPVVSPAYTKGLDGSPNEVKLKLVAESVGADEKAVINVIKDKMNQSTAFSGGTTPRRYADLVGSLCDLISGSGDKGTPVVVVQGYFDDYSTE